jgi:hypothetical protein
MALHVNQAQKDQIKAAAALLSVLVSALMFVTFWKHLAEIKQRACKCGTDLKSYRYLTAIIIMHVVMSAMVTAAFLMKSNVDMTRGLVAALAVLGLCEAIASFVWYFQIRKNKCECARSWKADAWVAYQSLSVPTNLVAVLGIVHMLVVVPFLASPHGARAAGWLHSNSSAFTQKFANQFKQGIKQGIKRVKSLP